ncbi:MAG: YdcF family protein [Desulfobacteraceae bacterium]|jgi:uncharacterized SAM-binding protein YcdF (DUF218 family)
MLGYLENEEKEWKAESPTPDRKPIEPEGTKWRKPNFLKWVFFLVVIVYVLLSYYHAPILTRLGRFLIVEHPPQKSDLIVCLAGQNIERGLAAADSFEKGLAPRIFVAREEIPDGYELLKQKGLQYPESRDLLVNALKGLGVPESAILVGDVPVKNTVEEAVQVRDLVKKKNYRSIILITSPTHSRRAWLIFRKVFGKKETRVLVLPTPYSNFKPEDWWKKGRYVREVILEYEKLIYYALKSVW